MVLPACGWPGVGLVHQSQYDDDGGRREAAVSSSLSGTARDVVQARDISGGVHFHDVGVSETPIPRQLPGDVHGFIGRGRELAALEGLLVQDSSSARLIVVVGTAGA